MPDEPRPARFRLFKIRGQWPILRAELDQWIDGEPRGGSADGSQGEPRERRDVTGVRWAGHIPFRPGLCHEVASALAMWRKYRDSETKPYPALAVYLAATHHGKARTVMRSTTAEGDDVFGVRSEPSLLACSYSETSSGRSTYFAQLSRLVNAYLDVAENLTLRKIPMTMLDWETRLNRFLAAPDREVLSDAGKVTAEIAKAHAESEFEKYRILQDGLFESEFDRVVAETKRLGEVAAKAGSREERKS